MHEHLQCFRNAILLGHGHGSVRIRVANEVTISGTGTDERTFRILGHLLETGVKHSVVEINAELLAEITDGLHRSVFMLADELHLATRCFLIGTNSHKRLLIGTNAVNLFLARVLFGGDVAEHRLDFLLHRIHINVTNHDNGLQIRTVPIVIEILDHLVIKSLQNVKLTDGHTIGVAGILHEDRPVLLAHTVVGTETETVFLDDDTALFINFLVVIKQTSGPATEDLEAEVDVVGIVERHGDHIDRLVEAGVGVEVGTEHHTLAAQVVNHAVARETFDTVEGHVLGEVRQALLIVVLLVGAGVHGETELHTVLRIRVFTNVVGQAVVQLANGHIRIRFDGIVQIQVAFLLLCENGQRTRQGHQKQKYFFHKCLFYK